MGSRDPTDEGTDCEETEVIKKENFVDRGMSPCDGGAPVHFSACCAGKVYFIPARQRPRREYQHGTLGCWRSRIFTTVRYTFDGEYILLPNVVVLPPPLVFTGSITHCR